MKAGPGAAGVVQLRVLRLRVDGLAGKCGALAQKQQRVGLTLPALVPGGGRCPVRGQGLSSSVRGSRAKRRRAVAEPCLEGTGCQKPCARKQLL